MIPNWTKVRVTEDISCSLVEAGDEGTVLDNISTPDKEFYLIEVTDKQEIVTVAEDSIVNVELN